MEDITNTNNKNYKLNSYPKPMVEKSRNEHVSHKTINEHLDPHINSSITHHVLPHHMGEYAAQDEPSSITSIVTKASNQVSEVRPSPSVIAEFFAGSAGGLAGICVGYPLDTIKTRSRFFREEHHLTWKSANFPGESSTIQWNI